MPQYLHFPSNLTDEEIMLQNKYTKLRRKKKALVEMRVAKPEPEKVSPLKRPMDPKDAKERAKRLIISGKIKLSITQADVKTAFKRPRALERKILATGRSEGHGGLTPGYNANYPILDSVQFEPFTPNPEASDKTENAFDKPITTRYGSPPVTPKYGSPISPHFGSPVTPKKFLSPTKSFNISPAKSSSPMSDGDSYSSPMHSSGGDRGNKGGQNRPKRGPTIYIQAHNLSEDILKEQFMKFGKVINVKLNNQTVGFVTYENADSAEVAVREMSGMTVNDISYDVQFARRQPHITNTINDATTSSCWSQLSSTYGKKTTNQDSRELDYSYN